jgi:cytoskeletal protein CcmA (bactofilin family)
MKSEPKLEPALVFDPTGHLAETAVTALVDGELAILPEQAIVHADKCSACADRIGRAALLAVEIAGVLEERASRAAVPAVARVAVRERRPLPVATVAAALVIAVIGVLPSLRALLTLAVRLPSLVVHGLPVYGHALALALSHAEGNGVLFEVWLMTAILLVVAGVGIARFAPRPLRYPGAGLFIAVLVGIHASFAHAEVRREGSWPENDPLVSLSVENLSRAEAIRRLATEAGWSVVVEGMAPGTIDVHVKKQPASKVLDLIVAGGDYRAHRDGDLIAIAPFAPPAAEPGPSAPAAGAPADSTMTSTRGSRPHGKDRVVTGSSVTIAKDEVVGDLVVLGGSAEVSGTVSGDIAVFGGSLEIKNGARVFGDVATFAGSVELDEGAHVDGDVSVLGGSLDRHDNAVVEGASVDLAKKGDRTKEASKDHRGFSVSELAEQAGGPMTRTALLFAFGTVLLALAGARMDRLQREVASRPVRSAALGVVGIAVGVLAVIALCVTILGIPIAIIAVLAAVFGLYAGVCAALTTLGAKLLWRRTSSPYVHLAAGCAIYLLLSSIPFVGTFVTAVVVLVGFGALVETRAAGFVNRGGSSLGGESYRPAAV